MSPTRLFRRFFPKFKPQRVELRGIGLAESDRYGCWTVQQLVDLNGTQVGLAFRCAAPGDDEIALVRAVRDGWPAAWSSIQSKLPATVWDDAEGRERGAFLAQVRPALLCFEDGLHLWEVQLTPDAPAGHLATAVMEEMVCVHIRIDG
jgi:hypothetical protein